MRSRHLGALVGTAVALALVACVTTLSGCVRREPVGITVSAAASLRDPLAEAAEAYRREHPGTQIELNLAGSGTLQKQIERGAPVDLFISAGTREMDTLAKQGLIDATTRRSLLGNRVVLIVTVDSPVVLRGWADLSKPVVRRLAMGAPETVPAGQYGMQVLKSLRLWTDVQSKLVLAKDVAQVVTYVKSGNVDAGIAYLTDSRSPGLKVVAEAPQGSHQPVVYQAAVIKSSPQSREARDFLSFLAGPEGKTIFTKYGFEAIGP